MGKLIKNVGKNNVELRGTNTDDTIYNEGEDASEVDFEAYYTGANNVTNLCRQGKRLYRQ